MGQSPSQTPAGEQPRRWRSPRRPPVRLALVPGGFTQPSSRQSVCARPLAPVTQPRASQSGCACPPRAHLSVSQPRTAATRKGRSHGAVARSPLVSGGGGVRRRREPGPAPGPRETAEAAEEVSVDVGVGDGGGWAARVPAQLGRRGLSPSAPGSGILRWGGRAPGEPGGLLLSGPRGWELRRPGWGEGQTPKKAPSGVDPCYRGNSHSFCLSPLLCSLSPFAA